MVKSNRNHKPPVTFQTNTAQPGEEVDEQENEESDADKTCPESVTADMRSRLREYKKKKSAKLSSRFAGLEAKQKAVREAAYTQIKEMKASGAAYIEDVKAQINALQEQEVQPDTAFTDLAVLWQQRSNGTEAHLELLTHFLTELSPARAEVIEENSTNLHSHEARFAAMRKRAMKMARRELHGGMEEQKLAADAQAYIKHYKQLIQG